ncbi:MAG: ABC transporter ATP-binding protein [Lachnospiraceae bacterium]|nr:ABC transporter ATP-binding protein [Lachnospiraceae bacterium]
MKQKDTLLKVLKYIRKYWFAVVLSLLLAAVTVVLTLYIPILTGDAVDLIIAKGMVDMPGIFAIMKKIALVMLITAAAQWIMNTCNNYITYHVIKDIRQDAFRKLEILPLKYLDANSYGDIVSRVIADVDTFADGLLMGFTQLFTGVLTILGTLGFMLITNVPITLVVVCITPVSFLVARFIATKTHSMFKEQSETRGEQTSLIEEMVGNQKIVKIFAREEVVKEQFAEINGRLQKCSLKAIFFSSITNPATRFVNSLVYAGVGIFGAYVAIRGGISVGRLSCFLSYANQYTKPFNEISGVVTELQNAFVCAARIFALIEEEPQVPDSEDAKVLEKAQGNVTLEKVSFSYVPEKPLIQNLNLSVKPGQRIAIVGPTGCGKTTLINLLMRFYDVNEGSIAVDGTDIREITRGSLRTGFGMVLQDTWLRTGTIGDNIRMGKPEASEEEVITAAKAAHAHSFIKRLPNGYDTVITEDGGSLSQGQKQLLCIARVMLCLPPMLILDEATSSIDTRTEIRIQKAFAKMMEGRTSFIVAHRLSTIQEADVILVMKDGNIIEQGNHETLLAAGGFYANLYNSQFAV